MGCSIFKTNELHVNFTSSKLFETSVPHIPIRFNLISHLKKRNYLELTLYLGLLLKYVDRIQLQLFLRNIPIFRSFYMQRE
jgi:hypothetical protein